ncbi:hypothetical protein JCM10212_007005 [Sporobolomyces blumeae]
MPKPSLAAPAAAAAAAAATTASCTCCARPTPRPRLPRPKPPSPSSISTSSTTSAQATAPDPRATGPGSPVLDFLYPGFGFFSRSLPPLAHASPRSNPVPHASSPPSETSTTLSATQHPGPVPPPPTPERRQFDVRNWRSSEGRRLVASPSPQPAPSASFPSPRSFFASTAAPPWTKLRVGLGTCVCGRVVESCLRCRGKSTEARPSSREGTVRGVEVAATSAEKGKAKETVREPDPDDSSTPRRPSEAVTKSSVKRSARPPSTRSSLRSFLATLDASLPSSRGTTVLPNPHTASTSNRRTRQRLRLVKPSPPSSRSAPTSAATTSLNEISDLVRDLSERISNEQEWATLGYYEKLDAIRMFARLAKLPQGDDSKPEGPLMSLETDPLQEARRRDELRAKEDRLRDDAGRRMTEALDRLGRDAGAKTRSERSEAGLVLEACALRGIANEVVVPSGVEAREQDGLDSSEYAHAVRVVFGGDEDWKTTPDEKLRYKVVQSIRTGLATLFEAWTRDRGSDVGERAFHLVFGFDLANVFDTVLSPSPTKQRSERAYNDVLRRQYGLLLSRLDPSPERWLERLENEPVEPSPSSFDHGLYASHLVEYLARSGSAAEARMVWAAKERVRLDRVGLDPSADDSFERARTLTALVDGLVMERLYEDANSYAAELEQLAKSVEAGPGPEDRAVALAAYRILGKLASNQGRPAILSRLQARVDKVVSSTESASPPASLESFARQLRVKSARSDLRGVRTLFEGVRASRAFADASQQDQARLWSQVILAHARVNDLEGAVRAVQNMVRSGLSPAVATVNAVLFGFARRGDVVAVDSLFEQLINGDFDQVRPDVGSWNALVLARTTVKDPSAAVRVIREMQVSSKNGLPGTVPNRQTWTTLMAGLVENGQWRQAFEVYRFLEKHPSVEFRPDTAATNVVLKACVLTATPASSVLKLFRQLLVRGFRPNMMTYTLVLQSLTTAGLMDLAEELYLLMDRPSTPARSFASSPSSTSTNPDDPAFSQSRALPVSMTPVRPDQFIFSTLIAGYLKQHEKAKARACLAEMRRRGMAPSSVTLAIIVGSRLNERSTPARVKQMVAEAREMLKEGADSGTTLSDRRRSQPARRDRNLALGDEGVAVFGPVFRSVAKLGLASSALELIDEVQTRRRNADVPIQLYAMLMDAFRRTDDPDAAADNVRLVWNRAYESVAARFVMAHASDASVRPVPVSLSAHGLMTSKLDLRVDPAQVSILCVPLTILLDALARAGRNQHIVKTWRTLARQGFAFDASNWNTLAVYYARDLQLERALWIAENVLCRPHDDASPLPSTAAFAADLANVNRANAVARSPSRIASFRQPERDTFRKAPVDVESVLSPSSTDSEPTGTRPDVVDFTTTFETAYRVRQATFWHPYGTLLEALEAALSTMALTADADGSAEIRDKLVADHPRTMEAIEYWRTRGERRELEKERFASGRVV